jgi:hypothetical protein
MGMIFLSILGIVFYFIVVHFFIEWIMTMLWVYVFAERASHKLTPTLGFIDRFFYALSFAFGMYFFVGIWLGIKTTSRLINSSDIKGTERFTTEGQKKNLFIIGNAISLVLGVIGGIIIRVLFSAQIINVIEWWDKLLPISK